MNKNVLYLDEMKKMMSDLYKTNTLSWIFILLAYWNKSADRHVTPLGHIIFWVLNAACFIAEKQQMPILASYVWFDQRYL